MASIKVYNNAQLWIRTSNTIQIFNDGGIIPINIPALYNWYAVNTGKLAPIGWRVPTSADWDILATNIGGYAIAGGKLKETGTTNWNTPNAGATDEYGFKARATGSRLETGLFQDIKQFGRWWSSTSYNLLNASYRVMSYLSDDLLIYNYFKTCGFQVRVMIDTNPGVTTINDYDGNIYNIIQIGTQWWINEDLKTTHYNDGVLIPNVTDNSDWASLTTGARCYYE